MPTVLSWKGITARACIVLAAFAALNVVTYATSGYFERERTYQGEVAAVERHPEVRVVFAGDSHFAVPLNDLIDADPEGPAYSIAFGGDSLRECYAKLREVLESSHTVDTLLVSADPHMFASGRLESSNRSFVDRYFIEAGDRSGLRRNWASALLDQIPWLNDDFLQYLRKEIDVDMERLRGRTVERETDETSAEWLRMSAAERAAAARSSGVGDHAGIGASPKPFYWYGRIIDLARQHHVRVIGLRFPVHPDYAAQAPPAEVAAIDRYLLQHGVVRIIDMRSALTDPHDFQNEDHVNETGAVPLLGLLERRLGRRLVNLAGKAGEPSQQASSTH